MIKCRAIEENSLFVTAAGKILPCCYIYKGGDNLPKDLLEITEGINFKKLSDTWNTSTPFYTCYKTCDDKHTSNPLHLSKFDSQWKNLKSNAS